MDNLKYIKEILEKFYEGQTKLEEERRLKEYFAQDSVPEELMEDRDLFRSLNAVDEQAEVPEGLNARLIGVIDEAEHRETRSRRINLYSFSGLAAGLLIIIGVYFTFLRDDAADVLADYVVQDEQTAYEEAKRALLYVSAKMNSGASELQTLEKVNQSMRSMAPLRKLSSGNKELQLLGNLEKARDIKVQ